MPADSPTGAPDVAAGEPFGGFPYGLEPLTLPEPGMRDEDVGISSPRPPSACRYLRTAWEDRDALPPLDPAERSIELSWFRWITGHQVSFIVWRLMAQAERRLEDERYDRRDALQTLARCVRGYCAMLLYTSSCTTEVYNGWIRTSMYLQHRGFSGTWAPDFAAVRHLFRVRRWQSSTAPDAVDLGRAVRLYKAIHAGVAAKLVPNGHSLLRESGQAPRPRDPELVGLLYDNYFMTLRAPVDDAAVLDQLLRRLAAVGQDVAANGLYPSTGEARESWPVELRSDDVRAIEQGFYSVCLDVAGAAAGTAGAPCC